MMGIEERTVKSKKSMPANSNKALKKLENTSPNKLTTSTSLYDDDKGLLSWEIKLFPENLCMHQ